MSVNINESLQKLKDYCEKEEFSGWDPYDGLNSQIFQSLPFVKNNPYFRLLWIQIFKRSPVNLRRLVLVKKGLNVKGLALFLNGYCQIYRMQPSKECLNTIHRLAEKIVLLKSKGYSGTCWGYNFDWQAKAFFQPRYTPTVVASTYAGYALLDAYEITKKDKYKMHALDVANFVLKDLNRTYDSDGDFSFSYSPNDHTQVYNASLLGSRMLARIYNYTHNSQLLETARKSVTFCCKHQKSDGSWSYGTLPFHQWVDNFHTGFNLECISEYRKYSGDYSFDGNLMKGFEYYMKTFFTREGIPRYYNNATYPIDVHATAQLIITLHFLDKQSEYRNIADRVLKWTIQNMQDKNGYFYYQYNQCYRNKISYMRWSQAWMFYALALYSSESAITKELHL